MSKKKNKVKLTPAMRWLMKLPTPKPPTANELVATAVDSANKHAGEGGKGSLLFGSRLVWCANKFASCVAAGDWPGAAAWAYSVGHAEGYMWLHIVRTEPGRKGNSARVERKNSAGLELGKWIDTLAVRDPHLTLKEVARQMPEALRSKFRSPAAISRAARRFSIWGRNKYQRRRKNHH